MQIEPCLLSPIQACCGCAINHGQASDAIVIRLPRYDRIYHDNPLDPKKRQIRLLKIDTDKSSTISCHFQIFDLASAPPFSALSYVWGPPAPLRPIYVNFERLWIRRNLHCFLQEYCKSKDQERGTRDQRQNSVLISDNLHESDEFEDNEWLWIDQICINQLNTFERNHQVHLMSNIYRRSRTVVLWLGTETNFKSAPATVHQQTQNQLLAERFRSGQDSLALFEVLSNEYFGRLWIVQEVLLATSVRVLMGGPLWLNWEAIKQLWLGVYPPEALNRRQLSATFLLQSKSNILTNTYPLRECIMRFSGNSCVEPRDRVYGFMGLVNKAERLIIDYQKPIFEVWLDALLTVYTQDEENPNALRDQDVAQILGGYMGLDDVPTGALQPLFELIMPRHQTSDGLLSEPVLTKRFGIDHIGTFDSSYRLGDFHSRTIADGAQIYFMTTLESWTCPDEYPRQAWHQARISPKPDSLPPDAFIERLEWEIVDYHRYCQTHLEKVVKIAANEEEAAPYALRWYYEHLGERYCFDDTPQWECMTAWTAKQLSEILRVCESFLKKLA